MSEKTEILYGIHPVTEALRAARRRFAEILVARDRTDRRMEPVLGLAGAARIPVRRLPPARISTMAGTDAHQGVAARVGPYRFAEMPGMLAGRETPQEPPLVLILDGVLDPHNLGAIIRTAVCAGVSGIVIPKDRSARPTPAVSKASAGAMEHVRLVQVTNLARAVRALRQEGLWIFGLDRNADATVFDSHLAEPVAVVIGGEGKGIRRLIREHCDRLIAIPQCGPIDALNASVAAAIVMYEAVRQRRDCGGNG